MKIDYYSVLEVDREADESTLKGAYEKLAGQFHRGGHKLREAAEAYKVLSDPLRRSAYDLSQGDAPERRLQIGAGVSRALLRRIIPCAIAIATALFLLVALWALARHLALSATGL